MLSRLARLMLTATAIAPVLLTYAWVALQSGNSQMAIGLAVGCVVLALICWLLLRYARRNLERMSFKPVKIEAADRENIAFLILYLLPLFTAQFKDLQWNIWIPALLVFAAVVATGYSYHFNPLLGLMGWHFYKAETEEGVTYVLITKRQLRTAKEAVEIGQLTEYIVLDLGGSNMPQNLFAACRVNGALVAKRIRLDQAVQQEIETIFGQQEAAFRDGITSEVEFDGSWTPDDDEFLTIDVPQEATIFTDTINTNPVAIPDIDTANFEAEGIKGIFTGIAVNGAANVDNEQKKFAAGKELDSGGSN